MSRLRLITGFLFLIALLTNCNEESIDPVPEETDSKVIYLSAQEENTTSLYLMSMNIDGTEQTQISDLLVIYEKPALSHSKTKIAFAHLTIDSQYELYSINIDGSNLSLIESCNKYCGSPAWSMDDTKIIYVIRRTELMSETDIILYDIMLNKKDTLTFSENNSMPQFLNQDQILFCRKIDNQSHNIFTMNLDGSDKQMIIPEANSAVLSPNGNMMTYISEGEQGSSQIFLSNTDGTNSIQLTETFFPSGDIGFSAYGNYGPTWTPDGEKIVYTSSINEGLPEIYIMNSDGSNQTRLTNTERRNVHPEITADGTSILFSSNRDLSLRYDIFIMNINGENQISLSNDPKKDLHPMN